MTETIDYLFARVCQAHRASISIGGLLARIGLHVGQEMVLLELWRRDGLKVGELADRLGVEPPTATRMLRRMESCGFVERRSDPTDARSFRVHLTEKGRSLEKLVVGIWAEAEEKTLRYKPGGEADPTPAPRAGSKEPEVVQCRP